MTDRLVTGAGIIVLVILALLTIQRIDVWQSDGTLWADALRVSPTKPRVLVNAGNVLVVTGHRQQGIALYERALIELDQPYRPSGLRAYHRSVITENLLRATWHR